MAIFTNLFQYWSSSIYNKPRVPEIEMTPAVEAHFNALEELSSSPDQIGKVYASVDVSSYLNELVDFLVTNKWETLDLSHRSVTDDDIEVIFQTSLPHITTVRLSSNLISDRSVKLIASKLPGLSEFDISGSGNVTDAGIEFAAQLLRDLRVLGLNRCSRVTAKSIKVVAEQMPHLEKLMMSHTQVSDKAGIPDVAGHLQNLKVLSVAMCWRLTNRGVDKLTWSLRLVTMLDLSSTEVDDRGIKLVGDYLTAVEALAIDATAVGDEGITYLAFKLTGLNKLSMSSLRATNLSLFSLADERREMTELDISQCHQVTALGIYAVATKMSNLKKFLMGGNDAFASVPEAIGRLTKLEFLDISHSHIGGDGVHAMAEGLQNLRQLRMRGTGGVNDDHLEMMVKHLTKLRKLDLTGVKHVSERGIKAVATGLTNLREFSIGPLPDMTDEGPKAVAERLTNLTVVRMVGCDKVTDVSLKALTENLPYLSTLELHDCRRITAAARREVEENHPYLRFF